VVITKEELEKIYKENSNDEASKILGISIPTMLKYLENNGIPLKGAGAHNNTKKIQVVD